jgi:hypothetical protein
LEWEQRPLNTRGGDRHLWAAFGIRQVQKT